VDAVVSAYLQFINETHRNTAREILDVLTHQKAQLEQQLVQKEAQLAKLQQEAGVLSLRDSQTNVLASKVSGLNEALTKARLKRMETEAKLKTFQEAVKANQPIELLAARFAESVHRDLLDYHVENREADANKVASSAERAQNRTDQFLMDRYRELYGPNHPRLQELEARLGAAKTAGQPARTGAGDGPLERRRLVIQAIEQLLHQELYQDQTLETELESKLEAEKAQAMSLNNSNVQLMALETEVDRLHKLFEAVITRIKDAGLGGNYEQVTARVISPPTRPQSPVSPNPMWVGIVSLCVGLGSGLALCQICEWLDSSFRGPDDIKWRLGLPILGHVPHIASDDRPELWSHQKPRSGEAEAFRTMRTAIAFSSPVPRRLVITSPEPGDGKTVMVCNLAVVFAQSGRRVLIIDADLRRPRIRDVFAANRSGGLSGLLRNVDPKPEDIEAEIQQTEVEHLSILCAGPHPPNPAELLTSPRFRTVLEWTDGQFDLVIIDSPPVLAVTDASILGRGADALLLVLKPDKNDRRGAVRARDTLLSMGCTVLGLAINDISPKQTYGYHYYGYGRYGYQNKKYGAYGVPAENDPQTDESAMPTAESEAARLAA
ncbi:MAG: polysaccharide biosynthesis tyrosine autokinase, partial [Planctomycetes bacterium]|nr:polysaccharide biosynthesis tyrosine autokinase [Planctomycetota bacterium]